MCFFSTVLKYFSMVKFAHTVFALPFAFIGFFLATAESGEPFDEVKLLYMLLCMVFARSTAMAYNRFLDRRIDAQNPRTQNREIPAGKISAPAALIFTVVSAIAFVFTAYFINSLCFYLSPVALLVVMGYSYTKRITPLCHIVLGIGLALAPLGAYLSVIPRFEWIPVMYSLAVLCWVSGFDILYALQDIEFDKAQKLKSIPVYIGVKNSLILSVWFHIFSSILVVITGVMLDFGVLYWIGSGIFISLLIYQHFIIKPSDLSRINQAFATLNGMASVVFGVFVSLEIILKWIA